MLNYEYVLEAYRQCAAWADCGPDNETEGADWSEELERLMRADVQAFCGAVERAGLVEQIEEIGFTEEQLGHDFWLTRNHHGAGFWDRKELDANSLGDALTRLAHSFGECTLYLGDDGKVYA